MIGSMLRYFPHFSRLFSARGFTGLGFLLIWAITVTFLLLILTGLLPPLSLFEKEKREILKNYPTPQAHLKLAKIYQQTHDSENAKREILLGLGFRPENRELKDALEEIEMSEQEKEVTRQKIEEWEKFLQDFPNYRDGYLELAVLYYQIYQNNEAWENLNKALQLDPNFEPARKLEKLLNQAGFSV